MISALFVRKDSIYKTMGLDCWDSERNALLWPGGNPAIFHPPCRLWSQISKWSTAPIEEKELAIWAVDQVRKWGGVLEHPKGSKLWPELKLPLGSTIDEYGGFTLSVNLHWFGFPAKKPTLLYIVGIRPKDIPPYPLSFDAVTHVVTSTGYKRKPKEIPKQMRDKTPPLMAGWLLELCKGIQKARVSTSLT